MYAGSVLSSPLPPAECKNMTADHPVTLIWGLIQDFVVQSCS